MEWSGWLGLGFGVGFAASAYVFSKGVRSRVHAVIRGVIWGSHQHEPDEPTEPAPPRPRSKPANGTRVKRHKCFVCPEVSPETEMIRAACGKQTIWIHKGCQGKFSEVQRTFDYH